MKLSTAAAKTLATIASYEDAGVNWYAALPGLDSRCDSALARRGLIKVAECDHDTGYSICPEAHGTDGRGDTRWYRRTWITAKGREALAA